jgi:hypothetical protein
VKYLEQPHESDPEIQLEGYVTEDNAHWICKACFEDFRDRFAWTVKAE